MESFGAPTDVVLSEEIFIKLRHIVETLILEDMIYILRLIDYKLFQNEGGRIPITQHLL
jgi:hypothetical protein